MQVVKSALLHQAAPTNYIHAIRPQSDYTPTAGLGVRACRADPQPPYGRPGTPRRPATPRGRKRPPSPARSPHDPKRVVLLFQVKQVRRRPSADR